MFSAFILIISLRLAFDARRYIQASLVDIERDEKGNIKIKDSKAKWFNRLLQKALTILNHIIKTKTKAKVTLKQKHKKKIAVEKSKEQSSDQKSYSKDSISYISHLLKKYEEFVSRDLTMMLISANNILRGLKQKIINNTEYDMNKFSSEFEGITELYHNSEVMINKFSNHCNGYQKVILEQKPFTSRHKIIESQLGKIKRQLEKGAQIVDLSKNKEYGFLSNYLKENQQEGYIRSK